jgi:hypothetical protein
LASFQKELRGMGLDEDKASELARESRGQLAILVRLLGHGPTARVPAWASPLEGSQVAALLLTGSWDRDRAADREAVQRLAGRPYAEIEGLAVRWYTTSDSPLRLTGSVWEWVSPDDGWYHLGTRLSPSLIESFEQTILEVLGMPDPRYTLPPDQRWAAAAHGQVLPHSERLRESLANSLAILALRPTVGVNSDGHQPRVSAIVRRLLGVENDVTLWPSLSQLLPLLAEAGPDAFLTCLEEVLLRDERARLAMFEQEGSWGGSPHTGLLWALENLAWSPHYLARVTVALGRLAAHDPGGVLANRPIASLREIFLTWLPHTRANLSQRLQAIDVLASREPEVAWDLCLRLLPQGPDHSTQTHKPRWRTWHGAGGIRMTVGEYWDNVRALEERLLSWVGVNGQRWAQLLGELRRIPRRLAQRLIEQLREFAGSTAPASDRLLVWEALRNALRFQRQVLEPRKGRLPVKALNALNRVYCRLEPTAIRPRVLWLFAARPELPDLETDDWKSEQQAVEEARRHAIDAVIAAEGTEGLLSLADAADQPRTVGWAVGSSAMTEAQVLPLLDACLASATGNRAECGRGLVMARLQQAGLAWPQAFFASGPGRAWPIERRIAFAQGLPAIAETWDLVASWGSDSVRTFWRSTIINWLDQPARDAERCIATLHSVGRPWAALDLVGMCLCPTPPSVALAPDLVLMVLDAASQTDPGAEGMPGNRRTFDCVDYVLEYLESTKQADETLLARMEWAYLPVLRHMRRGSPVLHRILAREPELFVDVLAAAFRSENEDRSSAIPDERAVERGRQAFQLLDSWHVVPGTQPDGTIDPVALNGWVDKARALCRQGGYNALGDQHIGQILARAPSGSDSYWPHEIVRRITEQLQSENLEQGLYIGLRNSRGMTSRAPDEGGMQERELVDRYSRAAADLASGNPRTAHVLREIAAAYERDAAREDRESALTEYE